MVRVLRQALWSPKLEPLIMCVREDDLTLTLEEFQARHDRLDNPGVFVSQEILSIPDGSDMLEATRRVDEAFRAKYQRERHQAMTYYWFGDKLRLLSSTGLVSTTERAPLSRAELRESLTQLAKHPNYKPGMTVQVHAEDGSIVKLYQGCVTEEITS